VDAENDAGPEAAGAEGTMPEEQAA
jgi:hypothetical protein